MTRAHRETIYRILFKSDLFKMIRDERTGDGEHTTEHREQILIDRRRCELRRQSYQSATIVPRSWDWENKGNREFKKVTIHHPVTKEILAEIYAYSSKAEPKAGDPVDVIWIDEAIKYPKHYSEWQARLADRRGRLFWLAGREQTTMHYGR